MTAEIGNIYENSKVGHQKGIKVLVSMDRNIVYKMLFFHNKILIRKKNLGIIQHSSDHKIHLQLFRLDQNDIINHHLYFIFIFNHYYYKYYFLFECYFYISASAFKP